MDPNRFKEIKVYLQGHADRAMDDVVSKVSSSRLTRMNHGLTWSEIMEDEHELQFELVVFKHADGAMHLSLSASINKYKGELFFGEGVSVIADRDL